MAVVAVGVAGMTVLSTWLARWLAESDADRASRVKRYNARLKTQQLLDLLLVHYGLDDMIGDDAIADDMVPLVVAVLEKQRRDLDELRRLVLWGDGQGRG